MSHDHSHGHENTFGAPSSNGAVGSGSESLRRLWWALGINFVFLLVEVAGGILSGSLALLADAGHMLTDVAALALAIAAAHMARRPPTPRRTFGMLRAEVIGAFINGASLVVIVGVIFWSAWGRMSDPQPVDGPLMLWVAAAGLAANLASAWVLLGSRKENLNIEGAFLHMAGDALGSVGAIVAGAVILTTGWNPVDPLVSVIIGLIILWSGIGLLRRSIDIILNATPENIDYHEVRAALLGIEHFSEIHDLHIWTVSSGLPVLSAHIRLAPGCGDTCHWRHCLREAQDMLRDRFGIVHTTLQLEPPDYETDNRTI